MKASLKQRLKQNAFYLVYTRIKHFNKERLETFVSKYYDSKSEDLNKIKRALKICYVFGGVRYTEFWANHFENKTWRERMRLIPCSAQNNLFIQANSEEWLSILGNKGTCYGFFRNYYGRDVLAVPKEDVCEVGEHSDILHFVDEHPVFIVKPLCSSGGLGVRMIDTVSMEKDYLHELFEDYPGGFIMEDRIIQVERMALPHRDSVNTIRVQTINYGDSIEIKWPCLRMGRGKSVVDNVYLGGVFVGIDVDSGKTFGYGKDALGNSYTEHPDSKVMLDGFQIPRWEELCRMLEEMAKLCPTCRVVGWDMALTKKGWVMVEANYGPELIYQDISPDGFYEDFVQVRKRMHASRFKGYRLKTQFQP